MQPGTEQAKCWDELVRPRGKLQVCSETGDLDEEDTTERHHT